MASEYPSWELDMLRCDRNRAERGAILWFSDALQMELRLCLHHSKLHNDALKAQGFDRPVVAEEVAV